MGLVKGFLTKLSKHPLAALRRACYHLTVGRLRYSRGKDYDARRFWSDRFDRYGLTLTAVGDEGLSEEENRRRHEAARALILDHCMELDINLASTRVLDIGCGTGFFAEAMRFAGCTDYTGVDITDVLTKQLEQDYPEYAFLCMDITSDITSEEVRGTYDLILMVDVIQHILSPEKLGVAIANAVTCLADGGTLILAPVGKTSNRVPLLYFVRTWSLDEVMGHIGAAAGVGKMPYRDNTFMLSVTKRRQLTSRNSRRPR